MRQYFRVCLIGAALVASQLHGAQQGFTVKQVLVFVRDAIKQKEPDKEVAQELAHMRLREKLTETEVETLQGEGAGPKTVAALKSLALATIDLTAPTTASLEAPKYVPPPPPPYEEQQDVIRDMTDYALNYTRQLPDFICSQVTRRYYDPHRGEDWRNYDTVVAKVSYTEGRENYELKLVNNTVVLGDKGIGSLNGAISTGEFGALMHDVFSNEAGAEFHWDHWATLRGHLMYVFNYEIEQGRSKYSIDYDHKLQIVTAQRGLVYVDKKSHKIMRLTAEAKDVPDTFPVRSASQRVDYDMATIGTRDYLVPLAAEVRMRDGQVSIRNTIEFRSYRRFGADTAIHYDDIPEPMDKSKTEEEPPKQ